MRLCVELKVYINGKITNVNNTIPDREIILLNIHEASFYGKIDLSEAYDQIKLDKELKNKFTTNTSQGLFKMGPNNLRMETSLPKPFTITSNQRSIFDFQLKCLTGEKAYGADVLGRTVFDENECDKDKVCRANTTSILLRVFWWPKQKSEYNWEQTPYSETQWRESSPAIGNNVQMRMKIWTAKICFDLTQWNHLQRSCFL